MGLFRRLIPTIPVWIKTRARGADAPSGSRGFARVNHNCPVRIPPSPFDGSELIA